MPFDFALQPVLDYRNDQVQVLEIQLARLLNLEQHHAACLAALRASREALYVDLRERQAGALDLAILAQLRHNVKRADGLIEVEVMTLAELAQKLEEQRQAVVAARQAVETLVKLKDIAHQRRAALLARQEEHQRDDVYISQAYRRSAVTAGGQP